MPTYRVQAAAALGPCWYSSAPRIPRKEANSAKPQPVADPSRSQAVKRAARMLFSSVGPAYVSGDPSVLQRASTPAHELRGTWQRAGRVLAEQKVSVKPEDVDMAVLSVTNVRAGPDRVEVTLNSAESAAGNPRRELPCRVRRVQQDNQWLVDGLSPVGPPPSP